MRYEKHLESGLVEITGNCNYVTEREIKDIKVEMMQLELDSYLMQDADYQGLEEGLELGFLFIGYNITRDFCQQLLLSFARPVTIPQ